MSLLLIFLQFYSSIGFHTDKGFNQTLGYRPPATDIHVNFSCDVPFFSREEKIVLSLNTGYQFWHEYLYILPTIGAGRVVYDDFTKENTRVKEWRPVLGSEFGVERRNGAVYINAKYVDQFFYGVGIRVFIFNNY